MSKGFFTVSYEICHLPDLKPLEMMVLARIASFGVFFESAETTAEFLNRAPSSVRNAKQRLERLKYIYCAENNGRGKKYIARADLRAREFLKRDLRLIEKMRAKAEKEDRPFFIPDEYLDEAMVREAPQKTPEKTSTEKATTEKTEPAAPKVELKAVEYTPVYSDRRAWNKWRKDHPDLVDVYMEILQFLKDEQVPVFNQKTLRKELCILAETYRNPERPDYHVQIIRSYLQYLQSPEYRYQAEHAQYCPRIMTQSDFFYKFHTIRNFKWNESSHYDPSKVLTP